MLVANRVRRRKHGFEPPDGSSGHPALRLSFEGFSDLRRLEAGVSAVFIWHSVRPGSAQGPSRFGGLAFPP